MATILHILSTIFLSWTLLPHAARMDPVQIIPFASVLAASLFGSGHCAAMCGGFVMIAGEAGAWRGIFLFHLGRLMAYLAIGASVGFLAELLEGVVQDLTGISVVLSAVLLLYFGFRTLQPVGERRVDPLGLSILSKLRRVKVFPLILGFFTAFLPCGWLYSFAAVAIGMGSILSATLVMFFFWLGTVPILSVAGIIPNYAFSRLRLLNTPRVKAGLLFFAAATSIFGHQGFTSLIQLVRGDSSVLISNCHGKLFAE